MWVCKKCNEENMDLYAECQKCGNAREETRMDTSDQPEEISEKAEVEMAEEEIPPYRRKPKTASIFDGLAIVLLCCGGLGAIICFAQAADLREAAEKLDFIEMGLAVLLGSGISGLFLHAFAELIWNTAVTKNCMVKSTRRMKKRKRRTERKGEQGISEFFGDPLLYKSNIAFLREKCTNRLIFRAIV